MLNYSANGPSGYNLTNSLRFRASNSAWLNKTFTSAGNRKIWTFSAWVKRGELGTTQMIFNGYSGSETELTFLQFLSTNAIEYYWDNGATSLRFNTTPVFRDPSAWYHIVLAVDTTQATNSNRVKFYVNGSQITAFSQYDTFPQNSDTYVNGAWSHSIGKYIYPGQTRFVDGYLTEVNFVNAQQLTPSSFGSTNPVTGVWQPAKYTGTYGTNGFYLNFTDIALTSGSNTGLGRDFSGNGNFFNTNNISVTSGVTYDAMSDVPTLTSATVANYAVGNPINNSASGNITFSQANLALTIGVTFQWRTATATMSVPSGKWYWEVTKTNSTTSGDAMVGIVADTVNISGNHDPAKSALGYAYLDNGQKANNSTPVSYGATWTLNDVIGIAFDADTGQLTFYKNGVSQGVAYTVTSGHSYYPAFGGATTVPSYAINFGQRPFSYTPPTGFVALNTFNLPTSTIVKGNTVMDATLYTGNGANRSITNAAGFRPDLVWGQARSAAYGSWLFDSVRGATKQIASFSTNAESTQSTMLTAFNSNGFSMGTDTAGNQSSITYVAWQWQAGSSTVTNTSGSISAQVRANTTTGFSIVTYTGTGANATVGHGLGVAPRMIIVKNRTTSGGNGIWRVYHASLGATQVLNLNELSAAASLSTVWNNTTPTSSVFSVGITGSVNDPSNNYVAYCWAEIAGFSRFGSYTGNGSTDGPFVYLGFRPEFLMIKVTSTTEQWAIKDATRVPYNTNNTQLFANSADAEDTNNTFHMIDFLSNGFKMRGAAQNLVNGNGQNYIYMAFAENPFKNALAR